MIKRVLLSGCALLLTAQLAWGQERIISTDAGMTELLVALGYTDQLVGLDVTSPQLNSTHEIANIGYHRNLSAEGLLSLKPTLILGSQHMGPPPVIHQLKQTQVQLLQLPVALDSDTLLSNIHQLAAVLNADSTPLLRALTDQLNALTNSALHQQKTVFLLDMGNDQLRIAGQNTAADAFIRLLGGQNPIRFNQYQTLSMESLLALEPEVLIVGSHDGTLDKAELLQRFPMLKHTPAVQQQKLLPMVSSSLVAGLSVAAIDEAHRLQQALNRLQTASVN